MAFDVSDVVQVSATVLAAPSGAGRNRGLIIGHTANVLDGDGSGKVKEYGTLTDVAEDFSTTDEEYLAAVAYFAQADPPPPPLLIARWADTPESTVLTGGDTPTVPASLTQADYSISVNGHISTAIDLSSTAGDTGAKVANVLQGKIRASHTSLAQVSVSFDQNGGGNGIPRYTLTQPTGAALVVVNGTGGTVTLATLLKLTDATDTSNVTGSAGETLSAALAEILDLRTDFYAFCLTRDLQTAANLPTAATWANGVRRMFIAGSNEGGAVDSADTTAGISIVADSSNPRAVALYSKVDAADGDHKAAALVAAIAATNYNQRGSFKTFKFLSLVGFTADDITRDERAALEGKRINYYAKYGTVNMLAQGVTSRSPEYIDTRAWLDWLVEQTRTLMWGLLLTRSIRMTEAGFLTVRTAVNSLMERARQSGAIAPGRVSPQMRLAIAEATANPNFSGLLSNGYLVYMPGVNTLTQQQRDDRMMPAVQVWLKGSSIVHDANIALTFEN